MCVCGGGGGGISMLHNTLHEQIYRAIYGYLGFMGGY